MIAFAVKDMAGNLKICDPQVDTVSQKNGKKKIIFRNVRKVPVSFLFNPRSIYKKIFAGH